MIAALVTVGGAIRYTEHLVIGDNHDAWGTAYTVTELDRLMRSPEKKD